MQLKQSINAQAQPIDSKMPSRAAALAAAAISSPPATPLKALALHDDRDDQQQQEQQEDGATCGRTKPRVSQRVLELGPSSLAEEDKTSAWGNEAASIAEEEESQQQQQTEQEQEEKAAPSAAEEAPATTTISPALEARLRLQRAFVLKLATADREEARQAVEYARARGRPVLLQGLLAAEVKGFSVDQLLQVPADVKVVSDDKTGIGSQSLREWGQPPKRRATMRADHPNWGKIASIMSEKGGVQTRLWERFMAEDMAAFRAVTGHTSLSAFAGAVFEGLAPQSSNLIVTGNAAPSAEGRAFELKSDAHQDMHDNLMLVASGSKVWALAALSEAQVAQGRKRKGRLTSSFALDAVDRTRNKSPEEHAVAAAFETVYMGPGDVLFNPAMVWHQVNSEPQTLAYSLMYPLPVYAEGGLQAVKALTAQRQQRAEAELLAGVGGVAAGTSFSAFSSSTSSSTSTDGADAKKHCATTGT